MANQGITISGLDDCLRCFDKAPENLLKVVKTALKDAAKVSAKELKNRTPSRWKKLVQNKVVTTDKGELNASFGYYNKHQKQGHQGKVEMDDWFKAYWNNYGTLSKRDPEHEFVYPIKHSATAAAKSRRNKIGIEAQHFFERGIAGFEQQFLDKFQESLSKQEDKLYER